jgi:hypothetical protein
VIVKTLLLLCFALAILAASRVSAQSSANLPQPVVGSTSHGLKIPVLAWAATAAADQITTYQFASEYRDVLRERNPLIRGLDRHPALLVAAGSALDATMGWASYRWLGRDHPRIAKLVFYGAAAYRAYLTGYNMRAMHSADKLRQSVRGPS